MSILQYPPIRANYCPPEERRSLSKPKGELVYKPGSVSAAIHLGYMSPYTSSGLPESLRGQRITLSYSTLLQVGFTLPPMLPSARCALTTPFHPYLRNEAVSFLWHFPWTHILQMLSGTLPCGARTFLYVLLIATARPTPHKHNIFGVSSLASAPSELS